MEITRKVKINLEMTEEEAKDIIKSLDDTFERMNDLSKNETLHPPKILEEFKHELYMGVDN